MQSFLDGLRSQSGSGMGDIRPPLLRRNDQNMTVSGNPYTAYNTPRVAPMPSKPMPLPTMRGIDAQSLMASYGSVNGMQPQPLPMYHQSVQQMPAPSQQQGSMASNPAFAGVQTNNPPPPQILQTMMQQQPNQGGQMFRALLENSRRNLSSLPSWQASNVGGNGGGGGLPMALPQLQRTPVRYMDR